MFLILFVIVGFALGYWLEMSRAGYLAIALTSIGFFAGEIFHVLTVPNRASLTLLPIVIGLVISSFMLLGALLRILFRYWAAPPR